MSSLLGLPPLDRTLPTMPDMPPAPTTTGNSPEQTLLAILKATGDLQGQPLIPNNNPLLAMGAALSGFAAGTQGKPNPTLAMLHQERAAQVQALLGQASIAGSLDSIQHRREQTALDRQKLLLAQGKDAREEKQKKIDNYTRLGQAGMASSDPHYRALGGRMTAEALKEMGANVPPEMLAGLTVAPLDTDKLKDALTMKALGVPDEAIIRTKGFAPETWSAVTAMAGSDDTRKLIGLKTQAEQQMDVVTAQGKALGNIQKQLDIATPPFAKELFTFIAAQGVDPRSATKEQIQSAAKAFIAQDLQKAMATAGAQPVSGTLLDSYVAISGSLDNLRTIDTLLQDPNAMKDLTPYMGTFEGWAGWREWAQRKAPDWVGAGKVPESTLVLAYAEEQGKNIQIKARSGAAVAQHEERRFLSEWPNRERDNYREYKIKHKWAMKAAEVLQKRLEILGGPGGRKALESGGAAGYSQFAAEVITSNPLPPPVKVDGPQPKLPDGWKVKEGP